MRSSSWVPPAVWMAVILWLSSDHFSSVHTVSVVGTLLAWAAPWLSPAEITMLHGLGRKLAHLTAYGILALLWLRALLRDTGLTRGAAAGVAFAISVTWAGVDEIRQHFVPSRSGTIGDVAIDAAGSALALGFAHRSWPQVARALGLILLWFATVGGAAVLAVNLATGVPSGVLWLTTPTAALVLAARHWMLHCQPRPNADADTLQEHQLR
ncbi:MAG: VanZ family protein [Candidatus Rokuibacteriota bacterium]